MAAGHVVDYNGMLKSLRAALAKYGEGPGPGGGGGGGEIGPTHDFDELEQEFAAAIAECEGHLQSCGFDLQKLIEAVGFAKIALLSKNAEDSAVNAVCRTDETRARRNANAFAARNPVVSRSACSTASRSSSWGIPTSTE